MKESMQRKSKMRKSPTMDKMYVVMHESMKGMPEKMMMGGMTKKMPIKKMPKDMMMKMNKR